MVEKGALRMPSLLGNYSLEEIPQAFNESATGHVVGKVSIFVG